MRLAFFSDIHGNKYVLEPFLKSIEFEKIDQIIFCGDIFGYYYFQNEIMDVFRREGFITLLGNHDQYFLDILAGLVLEEELIDKYGNSYKNIAGRISDVNINYLQLLPRKHEIITENTGIGVFHGSPNDFLNGRVYQDTEIANAELYNKYDFVVLGHTHHKMVRKIGKTLILNPGSIGQQRDGKGCSYLILDTGSGEVAFKIIEYDVTKLIEDINVFDPRNNKLKEALLRK